MARGAKTILAGFLDPLLPGFERTRYTWNRRRGSVVHVVDLQGSKHGTGDMTVNWGIAPIGWARVMYGEEPSVYRSSECAVDGRLGHFGGGDRWWELDDVRVAVPPDMESLLVYHLLPFLEQMDSPEKLQRLVERGYRRPRRGDPALDDRGWPLQWSGPGTEKEQELARAVLLAFVDSRKSALQAVEAVGDWERAEEVARRLRESS